MNNQHKGPGRPQHCRFVGLPPRCRKFKPSRQFTTKTEEIILTLDEYEALRLSDFQGLYQAEAANRMHISRQTLGRILVSAHKKVADALVNGKVITIAGGKVKQHVILPSKQKGIIMKIGIASDDQQSIAQHFGRTRGFVIAEVKDGNIMSREYRQNTFTGHVQGDHHQVQGQHGSSHGGILAALSDCQIVIAMGMGRRIYDDLRMVGIESVITTHSTVDGALEAFLAGELEDNPDKGCEH